MITFLCNAGANVGFGHLLRCRTIAEVLTQKKFKCNIVGVNEIFKNDSDQKIFENWIPLPDIQDIHLFAQKFIEILKKYNSNLVIIDDYRANNDFQKILFENDIKWLQFDSSLEKPLWPTWLVNPSPEEFPRNYLDDIKNQNLKFFHGPSYSILREQFKKIQTKKIKKEVNKVLITFGAGDDRGAILYTLEQLNKMNLELNIITGQHNPQIPKIQSWINRNNKNINLFINPANIVELFYDNDLAIISGGTTSFEIAACGIPFIILAIADNQIRQAQAWNDVGAAIFIGKFEKGTNVEFSHIINDLILNEKLRQKMSLLGQKLVDGNGAERIIDIILNKELL